MMELPRPAIVSPAPPARQAAPARDVALSLAAVSVARGVCLAGGRCPRVARWQKQAEILDVPVVTSKARAKGDVEERPQVNKHYGTTIVSTKEAGLAARKGLGAGAAHPRRRRRSWRSC